MGVLIKTMELPSCCDECPFFEDYVGGICNMTGSDVRYPCSGRADDCPMVPCEFDPVEYLKHMRKMIEEEKVGGAYYRKMQLDMPERAVRMVEEWKKNDLRILPSQHKRTEP